MSLNNYFKIMKLSTEFNTEYEIFGEVLEVEDCQEWAKITHEVTLDRLQGLKVCDDVGDCIDYLDQVQTEYLTKAKRQINPGPKLQTLLNGYFDFKFRVSKGFCDPSDMELYNETLFNCLEGSEAKNFKGIYDLLQISQKYFDLLETEIYNNFKDYKLEFMDKFKLVIAFVEEYEGRSLEAEGEELLQELGKDGIYNSFFECQTLGELFNKFSSWLDCFVYVDEFGLPEWETKPQELAHLIIEGVL